MAHLLQESRSPYWYIRFRDPPSGIWKREATHFRVGVGTETRKARELEAEYSLRESQMPSLNGPGGNRERWSSWVDDYLNSLMLSPLTIDAYKGRWENVLIFLKLRDIVAPRYVTYATCMDYLSWRKSFKNGRKKPAVHNTAVMELRVLSIVMGEAVRRGFSQANPCREVHVGKEAPREKPELTDEQIGIIRTALKTKPEWMSDAFELAIHHGCRISECRVPISDVDLKRGLITFRGKGGKVFTTQIHPGILPLLKRKAQSGAAFVANVPKNDSKPFHVLFKKLGFVGVSFHCTRVTIITRLARDPSIKQEIAMSYVNHSSTAVHQIYQRIRPEDAHGVAAALAIPLPAS